MLQTSKIKFIIIHNQFHDMKVMNRKRRFCSQYHFLLYPFCLSKTFLFFKIYDANISKCGKPAGGARISNHARQDEKISVVFSRFLFFLMLVLIQSSWLTLSICYRYFYNHRSFLIIFSKDRKVIFENITLLTWYDVFCI